MEECELLRADMLEQELNIEGEFVSEKRMREEFKWSEHLDIIRVSNIIDIVVFP